MNSKTLVLTSIWGVSVAAAFFAGKAIAPSNSSEQAATNAKSSGGSSSSGNSSRSANPSNSNSAASMASVQARLEAAPMVKKGSSKEEMITDIARSEDAIERNNALLALIDSLAPEDFLTVIDSFRSLGITQDRWGEYEMLLTAWAKVNPTEALDYTSENTRGEFARNTILSTWAATNPEAAIAWAEANHEDKERANPWLVGVIEGIAPNDISRATGLMESMPRSQERGEVLGTLVSQLMNGDPEDAKNWAGSIPEEGLRSSAYAFTAEAIARENPSEAAQWLAQTGDVDALNRASEDITQDWYRDSPEEATAWVNTLPPEAMSEAAEGIVENIVREDPVQAAEYISQLASSNPDANFDSSIRELVRNSARRDPELAAVWVAGLSDSNDQTRYYHRVLGDWSGRDSDAASAWMQANQADLPESISRRFLQNEQNNN